MRVSICKSILYISILFFISCQSTESEQVNLVGFAISSLFNDVNAENYDFVVSAVDGNVELSDFSLSDSVIFDSAILKQFLYPLLLKQEMNKGNIKGFDDFSWANKTHKIYDLFSTPNANIDLNTIESSQLDSIYESIFISDKEIAENFNLNNQSSKEFFRSMIDLSKAFQKPEISGFINDTLFSNPSNNRFLNTVGKHGGWRVFIFDEQLVLWNYFEEGGNALFMMNLLKQGIFTAVVYPKSLMLSPLKNGESDLLQSPLASKILRNIHCPSLKHINGNNALENRENIINSRYHFLYAKELIAMIQSQKINGNNKESEELRKVYDKVFPTDISSKIFLQEPLARIDYVKEKGIIKESFELKSDTFIRIFSNGQFFDESAIKGVDRVRDNIDLFMMSPTNESIRLWRRFFYHCLHDNGKIASPLLFPFAYKDISSNSYQLEIQLPWTVINGVDKKKCPMKAIFSFNDCDKDLFKTESSITHALDLEDIQYVEHIPKFVSKGLCAYKATSQPLIDGNSDSVWSSIPNQIMDIVSQGELEGSEDASCSFKLMWDDENLYLLFKIVDQAKTYPFVVPTHFCSIIDAETGHLVWKDMGKPSDDSPFYKSDDKIWLKKGKYILEYESSNRTWFKKGRRTIESEMNNCFFFNDWHGYIIPSSFYGTYIYVD